MTALVEVYARWSSY